MENVLLIPSRGVKIVSPSIILFNLVGFFHQAVKIFGKSIELSFDSSRTVGTADFPICFQLQVPLVLSLVLSTFFWILIRVPRSVSVGEKSLTLPLFEIHWNPKFPQSLRKKQGFSRGLEMLNSPDWQWKCGHLKLWDAETDLGWKGESASLWREASGN